MKLDRVLTIRSFTSLLLFLCLITCTSIKASHSETQKIYPSLDPSLSWLRELPSIDPEHSLQDPSLLKALDDDVKSLLNRVPALNAAIYHPELGLWSGSYGKRNSSTAEGVKAEDLFQVASITKIYTACVIFQMADEGLLKTHDSLDRWFKGENISSIQIQHLLEHSSGLNEFIDANTLRKTTNSLERVIGQALKIGPVKTPGQTYRYSNLGYILLGKIAEQIDQKAFDQILEERIFAKLKLENTRLRTLNDDVKLVSGHREGQPLEEDLEYSYAYSAGAIASTAEDSILFLSALLNAEIISPDHLKSMMKSMHVMNSSANMYYGKGLMLYLLEEGKTRLIGHSGGIRGFTSIVAYSIPDQVFISVLLNEKTVSAEAGLWQLLRTVRKHLPENSPPRLEGP